MSLLAKSIVAVDPIGNCYVPECHFPANDTSMLIFKKIISPTENEEDHKKAETAVSSLLEKADTTYRQTQMTKANLEVWTHR